MRVITGLLAAGVALLAGAGCARPPAAPSATPSPSAGTPTYQPGDQPPNYADNNRWKQRRELSTADRSLAEDVAARIRPQLEGLRASGDLAPGSVRDVLLGAGMAAADIVALPIAKPWWWTSPQPPAGVLFAIHIGQTGCVVGDLRPERVLVEVKGVAAEFGCLEPVTH
jgi:hypothetical protein